MRFVEFTSGLQTFVTKEDLTEREQQVARRLTEKSILTRRKQDDSIYFTISKAANTSSTY